jgi:hypothetical protein
MRPVSQSGMFMPSDTAMNSASVDGAHNKISDSERDTHTSGRSHSLLVGESSIDRDCYSRWHRASESEWVIPGGLQEQYDPVKLGAFTDPHNSPIAGPISDLVRFARYHAVATCV